MKTARSTSLDAKKTVHQCVKLLEELPRAEKKLKEACERAAHRESIELERLRILEESMRENAGKPPGYFTLPSMLDRDNRKESQVSAGE